MSLCQSCYKQEAYLREYCDDCLAGLTFDIPDDYDDDDYDDDAESEHMRGYNEGYDDAMAVVKLTLIGRIAIRYLSWKNRIENKWYLFIRHHESDKLPF